MTQVGRKRHSRKKWFQPKKKCNEKWGLIWSDFHPLIGCLVGLLRRGRKKDQLCNLYLHFEICPQSEIKSPCLLSHSMESYYSSNWWLTRNWMIFNRKISIMLLFRAFWKIEEWEKDGKCLLRVTIQKFLSSSEESRNTDVFLWSCNGKYEKLLLHCKWIYWKVFFPAKGPGCVCTCECVCVPMCVCM